MKKNILSAISLVAILTLMAKGLGMIRDILQARAFGTTAEVDLFTASNNVTIYLFTTAAYALCLAAVPIFAGKLAKDKKSALSAANNLITISVTISIVISGIMILVASLGLLGSGTGESGYSFSWYASVMSATLPIIVLTYLLMALFQAMGHYSLQGSLSLLYNIVLCAILLFAGSKVSVPFFAVLMSVAWVLQLAMILPYIIKEKYIYKFRFNLKAPEIRTYFSTALVTAFTTTAFLICYLLDTRQSAHFGAGVTSAFYYADKLFTPITTTLIYSIGAVMFPKWSELYATMKEKHYREYVGNIVENTIVLLLPLSVIFAAFGEPVVRVLFEGGSFDASSSALTGSIFAKYMLGMLGFALLDLFAKAYYAMGKTKNPLMINVAVILFNFALNFVAVKLFPSASVVSIVTSVCMTVGGIALALLFFKGKLRGIFSAVRLVKAFLISALMYVALYFSTAKFVSATDSKIMLIVKCGIMGVIALVVYLLFMGRSLIVKKIPEIEEQENE